MGVIAGQPLVEKKTPVASKETIRKFVKDLAEVSQTVKDARGDMNEVIKSNDEIQKIDEQIKQLREERKEYIKDNAVIQGYRDILQDAVEDRRQLIFDAKQDGVPRGEIDLAIKALKKDLDIDLATEMYTNIADLVD